VASIADVTLPETDSLDREPLKKTESSNENLRSTNSLDATIRVDVQLLDTIVDLVGELVLARNQLRTTVTDEPSLLDAVNRIHTVTGELQEVAMKTRMAPIEQLFNKFPRIVRDVATALQYLNRTFRNLWLFERMVRAM